MFSRFLNFCTRYLHRWELDAALDVLTMCSCHLTQSDPIRNEVLVTVTSYDLLHSFSSNVRTCLLDRFA